jgi:hypothetical protein
VNRDRLKQVLQEFESLRDPRADAELEAVKAAILLEDVFGIQLSDVDMDPGVLTGPAAMQNLVTRNRNST